ncbi:hypothetical protein RJ639_027171 [Escallonia herrerae]|uniref:non-specific serine/threonine protein kinase n=1 Tax=Escallonia herrerae TaxID=1293975 RepID=A0AA88X4W9_9ASTE|nr:hypothetical protein RJ639_027171 [Escallonia herrerae]
MEYLCAISLRMAVVVLSLLLLVELPITFASGLLQSTSCGDYQVSYVSSSGQELFYINGKLVEENEFCKVLKFYHENRCFITRDVRRHYCGFDLSLDVLPLGAGRKVLQNVDKDEARLHQKSQPSKAKYGHQSPLTPKTLAMAAPGLLLLCCSILCPCFYARRRGTTLTVLEKEPNLMDSASSVEMNSVSEKVSASPLRVPPSPSRFSMSPKLSRVGSVHLNINQLTRATQNFSRALKLGEGGFGTVYKAQLQDGQVVAVKRAKKENFGALQTEFRSEVELLAKIEHRNLVKLLGYVDKGNEHIIITEFVPNGTLREHLDGLRGNYLDFNQRLEVSIDVAHALTYLHMYSEKQIIHRDVKSSNILLTESMRAKVADFGFAKLGEMDDKTHVSTQVKGTVGYLDPEYMKTYQLTPKSDVYSFGVLLLEILTGRRPVDLRRPPEERVTIRWAFNKYNEGNVMELVDPQIKEAVDEEILASMFGLAIQCAAPTRADRPDMKTVGEQLWGIRMDYLRSGNKR